MKNRILIAVLGAALINSSGCARISPAFDKNYQTRVNTIQAARIAKKSDKEKPFDVSQILSRPSTEKLLNSEEWLNFMSTDYEISGDAAIKIVSTYSYEEIKQAMAFLNPMNIFFKGERNLDHSQYIKSNMTELDAQCQDADALFQGWCRRAQESVIRASVTDGGGSLLAKYNTAVLKQKLIREVYAIGARGSKLNSEYHERAMALMPSWNCPAGISSQTPDFYSDCNSVPGTVLNARTNANHFLKENSYRGIRHQVAPDYAETIKRIMAYGILLSAFEDINQANAPIKENLTLRQWLWESGFVSANEILNFSTGYWFGEDAKPRYGDLMCGKIPYGEKEKKMLATGRTYLSHPSLSQVINQKDLPLNKRFYLTEGSFSTFISNPVDYGLFEYIKIIAPRDSRGYPSYEAKNPVDDCVKKLMRDNQYISEYRPARLGHLRDDIGREKIAIPKELLQTYVKKWFDNFEKDRTAYRFR